MRICIITGAYPPMKSGGADCIYRFCCELTARGITVDVVMSDDVGRVEDNAGVSVYPLVRDWRATELQRVVGFVARTRPDVVHLQYNGTLYERRRMVTMLSLFIKLRKPGMRVVTNFEYPTGTRWFPHRLPGRFLRKVSYSILHDRLGWFDDEFGFLLSCSDRIIAQSELHRRMLIQALPSAASKIAVVPWGANTVLWEQDGPETKRKARGFLGLPMETSILSYYGYLHPGKGIETLLRAFAFLQDVNSNALLVIVGGDEVLVDSMTPQTGYATILQNLAIELGIAEHMIWTGFCAASDPKASMYLRASDMCVLPFDPGVSLNRTSVAAALAHGLPMVTTRGPFSDADFVDGENVLLCEPKDPRDLASVIRQLLSSKELWTRVSEGARKLYLRRYSWDVVVQRILKVYGVEK